MDETEKIEMKTLKKLNKNNSCLSNWWKIRKSLKNVKWMFGGKIGFPKQC